MSERNLLEDISPCTQDIASFKALAQYLGMKEELPGTIALANGARLTLSSKKDCYYMTTAKSCSCKGFTYGRTCKHVKELESCSKPHGQSLAQTLEEHDRNLSKMPASYRRMARVARDEAEAEPLELELIPKGGFKPVMPEEV